MTGVVCDVFLLGLVLAGPATAQENVAFSYDVHGRLIQVSRINASGPDSTSVYAYDPADNRTSRTITVTAARVSRGAPAPAPSPDLLLVDPTATPPIAPIVCEPPSNPSASEPPACQGGEEGE